ncbi:MAG: imelysin family protein [Alphaproteobacteria bacterium]|nr:imelysin family protein [Alphaproteobacteria bacterium]
MILLLLACTAKEAPDTGTSPAAQRRVVLAALAEDVALANYRDLTQATGALVTATEAFCAAPDAVTLDAARDAWWAARAPWKRAELIQFGPTTEQPLRLGPKMDLWPARVESIEAILEGDGGFTQADMAAMGGATRGFPPLEWLLWAEGDGTLDAFAAEPRRCAYAEGLAGDLDALAGQMVTAWEDAWAARLTDPADHDGDMYDSAQDVIDEWVNRTFFTVENIRVEKLGKPLGDSSGGEPLPDTLESRYSARSLADARDVLDGVVDALAEDHLMALVPADRDAVPPLVESWQVEAVEALAAVPEPLEDAIVNDRAAVEAAQEALRGFQVALQVDLAQALSVTVTFNDNDGD